MAERFGGRFSPPNARPAGERPAGEPPQSGSRWDRKRRSRAGGRSNILFFLPFLFLIDGFLGPPEGLILGFAAFGALFLAAWLTRQGILAEEAYDARPVARRPAIPRKIFASILTGAGLLAGGLMGEAGLILSAGWGVLGAGLHLLAFGPDPLKDKLPDGVDGFQSDRVARAVAEAETHLAAMREAVARLRDPALSRRVEDFAATARDLFRNVEADPGDLTAARRYLGVYLMGARDATLKFADLYVRGRDPQVRADYEHLLDDLGTSFADRTRKLLSNDRSSLDIEIEVLRDRLAREA
ncbi:5-bromo-4-chloroindolyl phosphate hydrolysis family protein [Cereibacter sphaeroides]|uniref:5-bromo-4-chloroindolyl phosphate hydrolysis family protein n=1 Tax=Cereibacter sphaeroides TaxID=1063 RepID=UPI001F43CE5B|nr:5-bromo-4-chloroindolyl phosphate hydrolysis family protein [Cereibacter sphaeroides]MCE6952042.1 5-bromo-4-chloroindolyl phosphate hydrolysis family protein [Cereibacter sphaeroides]